MTFLTGETAHSTKPGLEGLLYQISLVLPNFVTAATAVLTITDVDGYTIYTSSSQNVNGTRLLFTATSTFPVPIDGACTFTLTLNTGAGSPGGLIADVVAWVHGITFG
jgi:hypothetical protein